MKPISTFELTKQEFQQKIEVGSIVCLKREYDNAIAQGRTPILEQVYMSDEYKRKLLWQIGTHTCVGDYLGGEYYFFGVEPLKWKKVWSSEKLP